MREPDEFDRTSSVWPFATLSGRFVASTDPRGSTPGMNGNQVGDPAKLAQALLTGDSGDPASAEGGDRQNLLLVRPGEQALGSPTNRRGGGKT